MAKIIKDIHFTRESSFLGRNGEFKSIGLIIHSAGDEIGIKPITSKNEPGRCSIYIPQGSIPELIDTLRLFLEGGSDTTPIK